MKYYNNGIYCIRDIVPGMELERPLYTQDGKLILCKGTVLSSGLLDQLKSWGGLTLDIQSDSKGKTGSEQEPVDMRRKFLKVYRETVLVIKRAFEYTRHNKEIPVQHIRSIAEDVIGPLVDMRGIIDYLYVLRSLDDYTFAHSVNVAIIVGIIGKWLGYPKQEIQELILAGLLHDVGKTQIPLMILSKPDKLLANEMETMKMHTTLGYELLKMTKQISQEVSLGVLQHHERLDGSGYPHCLQGAQINQTARIIAVADIYDAMTSDRVYRRKMTPFHVVEALTAEMYGKIDPLVCMTFLNNINDYFIGNIVALSDGREAEVILLAKVRACRPVVRTRDGEFIDLEVRKEIGITHLVKSDEK